MTIISLHLPKTAGTSFSASLAEHFGERYQPDYADAAISKSPSERGRQALTAALEIAENGLGDAACVHGHFLPLKYLLLGTQRELTFITWMRDPVQRLLSHFYYWQESYDAATAASHHRQVIEEKWSLEKFCLSERFRNIYTQYLWGFPLENFSFIGISEYYREDLRHFSDLYLSAPLEPQYRNATGAVSGRVAADAGFLDEVRIFHAADVALYQRALQLRERRIVVDA